MDRQDIDALLIGALYGELTPAEEARLTAHLESHPADRGALDDLKVARQAVLDSRIFAVQLEPPQALSAILLQEAHRRAPKRAAQTAEDNPGWFARFIRSFAAHPAMAAATMLVLVLGGAGIMWMKKGDAQFASSEYSQASRQADEAVLPVGNAAVAAGSAYGADLYEGEPPAEEAAAADGAADTAAGRWNTQGTLEAQLRSRADSAEQERARRSNSVEVTTDRAPKELPDTKVARGERDEDAAAKPAPAKAKGKSAATSTVATGRATPTTALGFDDASGNANAVSGAGVTTTGGGYAQPPPSPGSVASGPATKVAKPSAPPTDAPAATTSPAPAQEAKKEEASLVAWAKQQHAQAVSLAKNGDCAGAARVALAVSNRASGYYAQYMATDRALKSCAQYINAERDKDAEQSQKSRAQKRVNADEPSPAKN